MNSKQIKKQLIDKDLTITAIARTLAGEMEVTEQYLVQALSDMTYGRRWYPTLANTVADRFGVRFVRPPAYAAKVKLRRAA